MEQLALFAIPRRHGYSEEVGSNKTAAGIASVDEPNSSRSQGSSRHSGAWRCDPPLHLAAFEGDTDRVLRLLDEGTNVNCQGDTWGSALNAAIAAESMETIDILLNYGAEIDAETAFGTALEVARKTNSESILNLLTFHKGLTTAPQGPAYVEAPDCAAVEAMKEDIRAMHVKVCHLEKELTEANQRLNKALAELAELRKKEMGVFTSLSHETP